MSRLGQLDLFAANIRVPRGQQGFWQIILDLDKSGPWTAADVDLQSNVSVDTIRNFIARLVAGGFAEIVEIVPRAGSAGPHNRYRLVTRQFEAPRLQRDGTVLPEPLIETLWRAMRIMKFFTASELADMASTPNRIVSLETAHRYVTALAKAEVTARATAGKRGVEASYRLVRDLGSRPPMFLRCKLIFDPNSNGFLGAADAIEVQP